MSDLLDTDDQTTQVAPNLDELNQLGAAVDPSPPVRVPSMT